MQKNKILGALAAATLASVGAFAEDSGFYVGASAGLATESSFGFDGRARAVRLLGGYSFSRNFAFEAGYVNAGKIDDTRGMLNLSVKSDGFFGTAIARLPLGKVMTPYAKFGYVFYDATSKVSLGSIQVSESTSDSRILFGGGAEFCLTENFRLRTDYEKVRVPDAAFDIYSLVATVHF